MAQNQAKQRLKITGQLFWVDKQVYTPGNRDYLPVPNAIRTLQQQTALHMNPLFIFLLIFISAPLVELYVLIAVGNEIGAAWTVLISILTALLGGLLVRLQGFAVIVRAQQQIANEEVPAIELLEGAALLLVGFALLLPGFITDAMGFLLLITPIRRAAIIRVLSSRGVIKPGEPAKPQDPKQNIIEGDFRRED